MLKTSNFKKIAFLANAHSGEHHAHIKRIPNDYTEEQILGLIKGFEYLKIKFIKSKHDECNTKEAFITFKTAGESKAACKVINIQSHGSIKAAYALSDSDKPSTLHQDDPLKLNQTQLPIECAYCGNKNARYACERCYYPEQPIIYCNLDHQKSHWPIHMPDCIAIPDLITVHEAMKKLSAKRKSPSFTIPNIEQFHAGDSVVIMSVNSQRLINVRPIDRNFEGLLKAIEECSNKTDLLTEMPEINVHILAPFNNTFRRSKVMETFTDDIYGRNISVLFVDYGNYSKVNWSSCKQLNFKTRQLPRHTFRVVLDHVRADDKDENHHTYLQDLCSRQETLKVLNMESFLGTIQITLIRESGENVNDRIIELSDGHNNEDNEVHLYDASKIPQIPVGSNVKIYVTDTSQLISDGIISGYSIDNYSEIRKIKSQIIDCMSSDDQKPYLPVKDELCILKYDDGFERASLIKKTGIDSISALLVDVGSIVEVPIENVLKMPKKFRQDFYMQHFKVVGTNELNTSIVAAKITVDELTVADFVEFDSKIGLSKLHFKFLE